MAKVRLPISGIDVMLREPVGAEDILLLEAPAFDTAFALELVARLAFLANGQTVEWSNLCVTDLDALLLLLRQMLLGNLIRTDIICPAADCGARIDVAFRIGEYLAHHRPRTARGVEAADEPGWFRLRNTPVSFRLPTAADQVAVAQALKPARELIQRCIRPTNIPVRLLRRIETAMEALAPGLSQNLQGHCPHCEMSVDMYFDVQQFVLSELRNQAALIYGDVHVLALHYHWSQAEILALPRGRRARYAEMAQRERSAV
jgi:hypothetical protein